MSITNGLTANEKILLAANRLESAGETSFGVEALIVAAWRQERTTFGIKGYEETYPDSNKILSSLMGRKGLVAKGWLERVSPKIYRLGREGRRLLPLLLRQSKEPTRAPRVPTVVANGRLSLELARILMRLLESPAATQEIERLTFVDARAFWGIQAVDAGQVVDDILLARETELAATLKVLAEGGLALPNGRWIEEADVRALDERHRRLKDWFQRQLNIMRRQL